MPAKRSSLQDERPRVGARWPRVVVTASTTGGGRR
eukprot:CAMPEP_0185696666 /NCGR_PEP_ID=MMETSP1164-20130828/5274_1 /TAXON_ID=1104430 /ORGANISM="Chrysoreinhardia sp, Strain CCMP2950" /LENGTH=34 /DNA_ID= /DNA_START= /DNA_END= /DNA_ORIENTATION=